MIPARSFLRSTFTAVLAVCMLAPACSRAAEIPGEEMLPDNALLALLVPDIRAAQSEFEKGRLAQMYAQPMMQEFLQPILAEIKRQEAETLKANPGALKFDAKLFDGSLAAAIFASPARPAPQGGFTAIFSPKAPAKFLAALPGDLAKALQAGKLAQDPKAPARLFWIKERLILVSPGVQVHPKTGLAVLAGKPMFDEAVPTLAVTTGFKKVKERLASSAAWVYAAPQPIFALASGEIANPAELNTVKTIWTVLGLDTLDSAGFGLGFRDGDLSAEGFAGLSAAPKGLFALAVPPDAAAPPPAVLKIAAGNAPYAASGYFNFAGVLPLIKAAIQASDPRAAPVVDAQLQAVSQALQFDLQRDVLENIDGHFVAAQTALDTSLPVLPIPGMVYSFSAKNPAKLEECLAKAETFLGNLPEPINGKLKLKKFPHLNKTIYYLSGPLLPLSPTLCIHEGRLLLGTSLNAMKRTLEQHQKTDDILGNKNFQQALARMSGEAFGADKLPAIFSYGVDQGTGEGALFLAAAYLSGAASLQMLNAALPPTPGGNAAADLVANEAAAYGACMGFAEAEEIFHRTDYDADGVLEYAQALKGDQSLFEKKAGAGDLQLIAKEFAEAEGNPDGKAAFKGYRFKVLKSMVTPEGVKKPYVVNGNLTLGYALLAYPLKYGVTGKRAFMISNAGLIFGIDWGQATAEKAAAWEAFDSREWELLDEIQQPEVPTKRAETVGLAILKRADLGFWPDAAFFDAYRRPSVAIVKADAAGIYWRSDLPPPMPTLPRMDAAPIYVGVAAIGAGLILPVLARARESARRTSSAANMNQMAKAAFMFADVPANGGKFPTHPGQLYPNFVANVRVFKNPRSANEDVGYIWVSGLDPNMERSVLAYESPLPNDPSGGRNVVFTDGSVEWIDEANFPELLAATEKTIKAAKREMKQVPISVREILGDKNTKPPEF